jgi:hypothetical protein
MIVLDKREGVGWMSKDVTAYGVTVNEYIVWLDDYTAIIREGGKPRFKLTGIIRGNDERPLTYFFNSYSQLDSFNLSQWIYYIKKI